MEKGGKGIVKDFEKGVEKVGGGIKKSAGYVEKESKKAGSETAHGLEKMNPAKKKAAKPVTTTTTTTTDSTSK
jgi:hypothetical protein